MKKAEKNNTDTLDVIEFFNKIIIGVEDEPASINCPYPDMLTRKADYHYFCQDCDYADNCFYFKNEATPDIFYYEFMMSDNFFFRDEDDPKDN